MNCDNCNGKLKRVGKDNKFACKYCESKRKNKRKGKK